MTLPFVTVMMPVRNEAAFIERSLGAILAQDYPPDRMEILIADGRSDDNTVEIIRRIDTHGRVRVVDNPGIIQAIGLNQLIEQAQGEYLIRVDGHTIIAPDYVRECVRLLQATGAANVGGPMHPVGDSLMGRAIAAAGRSPFAVPSAFHVSSRAADTDTVYMGAWPRAVLAALRGYKPMRANEDYELNVRIRQAGGRIYFSPTIQSLYYGRQTLPALWKQYYRYGRSKVKTLRLHPRSLRPRQIVAPLFVAGLVLGPLMSLLIPALAVVYWAALAAYVIVNLAFSVRQASQHGWELLPLLPLAFLTIHLAWGLGFWRELLLPDRDAEIVK
jgi:cellulose synthase/poly-beta-1,6-N-acetylglucosamine synthase-like glycosyltransferase